jgi:hypothetical protein
MTLQNATIAGTVRHRAEDDLFHYDRARLPSPRSATRACRVSKRQHGTGSSACAHDGSSTRLSRSCALALRDREHTGYWACRARNTSSAQRSYTC